MTDTLTSELFIQIGLKRYAVDSLQQASEMFCTARDRAGEGASKTPTPLIIDGAGNTIGHVSYNGRVWPGSPRDWQPGRTPLYDNRNYPPTRPTNGD